MEAVIGVDPHKYVLTAVALDGHGAILGHWTGATSGRGLQALRTWAATQAVGTGNSITQAARSYSCRRPPSRSRRQTAP